jgi:hypothetical protein
MVKKYQAGINRSRRGFSPPNIIMRVSSHQEQFDGAIEYFLISHLTDFSSERSPLGIPSMDLNL